ncbi:geranylgeranyl reductase family protein [Corynebacterium yudongzhengii]|nr:geranylgeranyl reductase family protein [Corynebacterium yudongzhengii]
MTHASPAFFDLVVIGAGPAGSAAAIHGVAAGYQVLLVESGALGRDKTCGDGLTPRAISELRKLGLADVVTERYTNRGLKLHGYGGSVTAPWPESAYGTVGSAMPRTLFDEHLARTAQQRGADVRALSTAHAPVVTRGRITELTVQPADGEAYTVRPKWVIVADGVRSPVGKELGRRWHREEVYGIAARSYVSSPFHAEPWMHSHVELRGEDGAIQPGYGWIFPLGDGTVNLGCGALSTNARPAKVNTKKLLDHYADLCRPDWQLGMPERVTSALLPMGGAVSQVAGGNWMLIGDAAAGVNPLNGEGIDYGLEMAEWAIDMLATDAAAELRRAWPELLRERYGEAFLLARTAARLLTYPQFLPTVGPLALRGPIGARLMPAAARLMANLITDDDRDLLARMWRAAGHCASAVRRDTPLWS